MWDSSPCGLVGLRCTPVGSAVKIHKIRTTDTLPDHSERPPLPGEASKSSNLDPQTLRLATKRLVNCSFRAAPSVPGEE
ncbi:hypothetical protein NPIL_293471 [Nephila pilipes]|uniref:Uncharacterized protein n=1 Tax=Nephila pilipes TaxID=299642 RepID=A0A8X6TWS1_NEPPI|nr:hypothetical protein NPIL_293471 [Nephila pilipes]